MKLKLIAIALVALLAVTVAPTVVAARDGHAQLPTLVVRPVYAIKTVGTAWRPSPQVGAVVYNTQTGSYMVVASGLAPITYSFGMTTTLPSFTFVYPIDKVSVNSQGRTLAFGQTRANSDVATIDQAIASGEAFIIFL
jgi:hypothetical protein